MAAGWVQQCTKCGELRLAASPLPIRVVPAAEPAPKAVQQLLGGRGQLLNGVENLDQVGVRVLHAAQLHGMIEGGSKQGRGQEVSGGR